MTIVGEAHIIVRAITTNVERDIQRSLRGITTQGGNLGRQFGQSFGSGFSGANRKSFSQFRKEALAATDAFRRLVTQGYFVGPAIAFAAAGISSLVSGLVALTSQIALAAPSLIVLPSIFTALGQAMGTAKLAFSGIGEALKQTGRGTKAVDRMPSLLEAAAAARERLNRAEETVEKRLLDIAKAAEQARERIQQLRFEAEDAAISEKRAALQLEKARESLARLQDLPPNSRARREAELAYQEADLNYRQAVDRNGDLKKELNDISANGTRTAQEEIDNSEEVVNAQEAYAEAVDGKTKAAIALVKAEKAVTDEMNKSGAAAGGAADAMSKLSKEAQEFVRYLQTLKPLIPALKEAAGAELFPQLETAIGNLVTDLYPKLIPILRDTGDALGYTAVEFSKILTAPEVMRNLQEAAKTNEDTIRKLGTVVGNLVGGFVALLAAADPLVRRFTDWAVSLSESWRASMETKKRTGELTDTFNTAGDVAAQLGDILGNIWGALKNIGRAASGPGSGGEMLLNAFEGATEKFEAFTKKLEASGKLEEYFKGVATNLIEIGRVFSEFVLEFLKLGDDEGVATTAQSLSGMAATIGGALSKLLEGAPALGEFVNKFAEFLAIFAESGSINKFFGALNKVMDVLIAIFSNEMVQKVVFFITTQLALVKAFQLVKFFAVLAGKIVVGYLIMAFDAVSKFAGAVKFLGGALGIGTGPMWLIVAAVAAAIAVFVIMYNKSEKLRKAVKELIDKVLNALRDAWYRINEAIKEAFPTFEGVGDIFAKLGDFFAKYIIPIIGTVLVGVIELITDRIVGFIKIVGGIITIFKAVWDYVQGFFALLSGDTEKAKEKFQSAWSGLVDGIGKIFSGLADIILAPFRFAFNLIADIWNNTVGKLEFTMPDIPGLPGRGKKFKMPQIPKWEKEGVPATARGGGARLMAKGGVVRPSDSGTLAIIAEAGRPERVEPLDPDGLSRRDKAMIEFMTGGMNGATFNIYPSPGMDEVELASLVSRQIAFQLRKGAA